MASFTKFSTSTEVASLSKLNKSFTYTIPKVSSNEFKLIGVDESLQKEIKNKRAKTSLVDFTSLF